MATPAAASRCAGPQSFSRVRDRISMTRRKMSRPQGGETELAEVRPFAVHGRDQALSDPRNGRG